MEPIIPKAIRRLKTLYIVHIIVIALILIFNFISISQIYWLKNILKKLYLLSTIISIIFFTLPIISLIFICTKKLKKSNYNIFKVLTLIFCVMTITLGFFFSGILMMDAIESPEFCKECPFNLPIKEISNLIQSNDLKKKCKERRCVINNKNYEILEKNENDFYEYLCNYNPTSEFDEIKETNDNMNSMNNNINNENSNKTTTNMDNIKCNKIQKDNLILSDLENNYVFNFYDACNPYSEFYSCERSKAPNKLDLGKNFVCPGINYMTLLITFCMFNIILNLVVNFMPFKLEYNKYVELTAPPRIVNPKSNSFNSTINSSKIPKDNNIETEDKFERSPTEILIIVNNKNKDGVNNINKNSNKNNEEDNNDENNIDNEIVIKKTKTKKVNITSANEPKKIKVTNTEFKSTKNMRTVNNINFIKKIEEDEEKEEKKEKKIKKIEEDNKVTLSYDDNTISTTKRNILGDDKSSKF